MKKFVYIIISMVCLLTSCKKDHDIKSMSGKKLILTASWVQENNTHWMSDNGNDIKFEWNESNDYNTNMIAAVFDNNNNNIVNWGDKKPYSYLTVKTNGTLKEQATLTSLADITNKFTKGCNLYCFAPVKKEDSNTYSNSDGVSITFEMPNNFILTDSSKLSELKDYTYIHSHSNFLKKNNGNIIDDISKFYTIPSIFRFSITNSGTDTLYFQKIEMIAVNNVGDTLNIFPSKLIYTATKNGCEIKEVIGSNNHKVITSLTNSLKGIKNNEKHLYYALILPADSKDQFKDVKLQFKIYCKKKIDNVDYDCSYKVDKDITNLGENNSDYRFLSGHIYAFDFDLKNMEEEYSKDFYKHGDYKIYMESTKASPIKLFFLGDGYVKEDYVYGGTFDQHMNKSIDALFSLEPYKTYKDYFTVYKVAFYSKDRGVTILEDMYTQGKKNCETFFETKVSGGYGTEIRCNDKKVYDVCSDIFNLNEDDLDNSAFSLMLNEEFVYSGTCMLSLEEYENGKKITKCVAITPFLKKGLYGDVDYKNILMHEFGGHGFGRLRDEYYDPNSGEAPPDVIEEINTLYNFEYGLNVSTEKDIENTPWKHFQNRNGYSQVSVFEGANYYAKGRA